MRDKDSAHRSEEPGSAVHEASGFWLEYGSHTIELNRGHGLMIGRSTHCDLVFDDALVSRKHAQISVQSDGVVVEDLESANGVFVNGERIRTYRQVQPGDRVVIGKQEMVLRATPTGAATTWTGADRTTAETLHGSEVSPAREVSSEDSTRKGDVFELLGTVADKVLALGRGAEAERILGSYLTNVMETAQARGKVKPEKAEKAARYAVKIASATRKGSWVDYCFRLYLHLARPLPGPVVDELYDVLRKVSDVDLALLRRYLATLQEEQRQFGPNERFLVQRIEGLEKLAALK